MGDPDENTGLIHQNNPVANGSSGTWSLFYFFCFLSGQYINVDVNVKESFKKLVSVVGVILFGIQFLLYLGHVSTAVTVEACRIGNINTSNSTFTENCTTSCPANGTVTNSTTMQLYK